MPSKFLKGDYPAPHLLTWGDIYPILPKLAQIPTLAHLSVSCWRSANGKLHPFGGLCHESLHAVEASAELSELTLPNVRWHDGCEDTRVILSGTRAETNHFLAFMAGAHLLLDDETVKDVEKAFEPLRVFHLIESLENYIRKGSAKEFKNSAQAATIKETRRLLKASLRKLRSFSEGDLIKEQILRVCLLSPENAALQSQPANARNRFESVLVSPEDRKVFYLGISGALADDEFFNYVIGGYWVFTAAKSRNSGAVLFELPQGVLTRFKRSLSIKDEDYIEATPTDSPAILETAIELFDPASRGPHATLVGAFAAARVL